MGIHSVLPLRKSYSKIGPLWSIRCLNYLNPWKGQLAILAMSTDSDGLRNNFMNAMGKICCYNWKRLPSGLFWSFSLRWKSTYKSAWSPCYHSDHCIQWKSWKMPIIRLYVILKTQIVKHVCITDLVSPEVELCHNV